MTFTLIATPDASATPPRVRLDITSDDPGDAVTSLTLTRDGVPVREQPYAGGSASVAFDYEAPFGVPLTYDLDGEYLPGVAPDWTETWSSLAAWTGDTSDYSTSGGKARSSVAGADIVRSATGTIQRLDVTDPTAVRIELLTLADVVVASVQVGSNVIVTGKSSTPVTGGGSFTATLLDGVLSVAAADSSWAANQTYVGVPVKVRVVSLAGTYAQTAQWSSVGNADAVAVAPSGDIYTLDIASKLVRKFTSAGVPVTTGWPVSTVGTPADLTVLSTGAVLVADATNHVVRPFSSAGSASTAWATSTHPAAIGRDSTDHVYVLDESQDIHKYTSAGVAGISWAVDGGMFAMDVNPVVDVIVSLEDGDGDPALVQRFNTSGTLLGSFTQSAIRHGNTVAVDDAGLIYAANYFGGGAKFSTTGTQLAPFPPGAGVDRVGGVAIAGTTILLGDLGAKTVRSYAIGTASVGAISPTAATSSQPLHANAATELDVDDVWLIHPVFPSLSISLDGGESADPNHLWVEEASGDTKTSAANRAIMRPIGRTRAVVFTNGSRQADEWALIVGAPTIAGRKSIRAIVDDETPLLLRLPMDEFDWDLPDGWYSVGDLTVARPDTPYVNELTLTTLPLTPVDPPVVRQTSVWTYGSTQLAAPTYAAARPLFPTYLDRLAGETA